MKTILLSALFLTAGLLRAAPEVRLTISPAPICEARWIRCNAAVETAGRVRTGRHGEQGPNQLGARARHDSGTALRHLRWLLAHLPEPTPERLALAWNAGLDRTLANRCTDRQKEYAARVANLYNDPNF